jgi:hypothetical protein
MNSPNISRCPECNREYRYRFRNSEVECPMGHVWQLKDEKSRHASRNGWPTGGAPEDSAKLIHKFFL